MYDFEFLNSLSELAKKNLIDTFIVLASKNKNIEFVKNALNISFNNRNFNFIEFLFNEGLIDTNISNNFLYNVLSYNSYYFKDIRSKCIKLFIENKFNLNSTLLKNTTTPLIFLMKIQDFDTINYLFREGLDVNFKFLNGNTALIQVVRKRFDIKTINYILEKGADVNLSNNNGETPLHTICMRITKSTSKQDIEILELLLKYGADITAKTTNEIKTKYYTFPKGSTPLDIIKIKNARKIENILKNHLSKL